MQGIAINIAQEKEGTWFDFNIDHSENVEQGVIFQVKVRPLTKEKWTALSLQNAVQKKKKTFKIKGINWENLKDDVVEYVLEDFKGLKDTDGYHLSVNFKNKNMLFDLPCMKQKGQSFCDWIMEKALELGGEPKVTTSGSETIFIHMMNKWRKRHGG